MTANSYSLHLTSSTNSTGNVSLPTLGGLLLLTQILLASTQADASVLPRSDRYVPRVSGTFGQYQNAFTGAYTTQRAFEFEDAMAEFYAKLQAQQQPLGADFAKILYDNLWDLYEG